MTSANKVALSLCAHPDDTEFRAGGTLALLKQQGWAIHIATMTAGELGSTEHCPSETGKIRKKEAIDAANILNGDFHCLECDDGFVNYNKETILKVIKLLREIRPALVFTNSLSDYHVDHEMTGRICRQSCFLCGAPNIETRQDAFNTIPHLYYMDPVEGTDVFGKPVTPEILVDITSVVNLKQEMAKKHKSQRQWLKKHHKNDDYIENMLNFSKNRGALISVDFAEGFRQNLSHAFPKINLLKTVLRKKIVEPI